MLFQVCGGPEYNIWTEIVSRSQHRSYFDNSCGPNGTVSVFCWTRWEILLWERLCRSVLIVTMQFSVFHACEIMTIVTQVTAIDVTYPEGSAVVTSIFLTYQHFSFACLTWWLLVTNVDEVFPLVQMPFTVPIDHPSSLACLLSIRTWQRSFEANKRGIWILCISVHFFSLLTDGLLQLKTRRKVDCVHPRFFLWPYSQMTKPICLVRNSELNRTHCASSLDSLLYEFENSVCLCVKLNDWCVWFQTVRIL